MVDSIAGKRFGSWLVLSESGVNKHNKRLVLCKCECGTERPVVCRDLIAGKSRNCGCKRQVTHGKHSTPEYGAWHCMIQRCTNPNNPQWSLYGGRGIMVCEEWRQSFDRFFKDMGNRPSGRHSLDRIDNNGNYEPSNCRWATKKQQARNTRRARVIEFNGESLTMIEWAERTGIDRYTIRSRLRSGWAVEVALTAPVMQRSR